MASKTRSEIFAEQLANVTASLQSKYDLALKEADDGYDGRVFRDCEYNYSVLFGYVKDANLLAHYQTAYDLLQS